MKIIPLCFYILFSFTSCKVSSDSIPQKRTESKAPEIGTDQEILAVQVPAEFPGGVDELRKYIQNEIDCSDRKYKGRVHIVFIVTEKGKIRDPRILRSSDENSNDEAIKIVNHFPDFIPATEFGNPTTSSYSVIIDFSERSPK